MSEGGDAVTTRLERWALVLTPLFALAFALGVDLTPGRPEATQTAAVAIVMAVWWITGALPLAATALLPLVLFPLLGIMDAKSVSMQYLTDVTFLFIGGFLVALAMERWDLHRRMALRMMLWFGVKPRLLMAGFLAPTFFITMWITNSAATMMMLPIASSIVASLSEQIDPKPLRRFASGLFLGVAYSASIGGVATLIGTPTNLAFVRTLHIVFPNAPDVTFSQWFFFAFPMALLVEIALWVVLCVMACPRGMKADIDPATIRAHYDALGPMTYPQKMLMGAFVSMALLWFTRSGFDLGSVNIPGWSQLFPVPKYVSDGTVGMAVALVLFMTPSRDGKGGKLLDWDVARRLPWDVVLLFGGGFALAQGFVTSGLSEWFGGELKGLGGLPPMLVVLVVATTVCFLSELTSNVATAEMVLPILGALSVAIGVHPFLLMIPATLAASFAFMLPAGTPPNAIVYATGKIRMREMIGAGFVLNWIGVVIVTGGTALLGQAVFGLDLTKLPEWGVLAGQ